MSAPIYSLLAEELDISEERAQKLLTAMLREVRKRAHRQGVRLPNLGTFREEEGQLTFEAADSLSRIVNQRFEGLEDENLAREEENENDSREEEGPSTITLGYQANDWSPIESSESEESTSVDSDDPPEADTEEFQVPSTQEEAADTEELNTQDVLPEESAEEPEESSSQDPSSTDTEELYPLVEDVPGTSTEEASSTADSASSEEQDHSEDSLGEIWSDEESSSQEEEPTSGTSTAQPDPTPDSPPTDSSSTPEAPQPSRTSSFTSPILVAPFILLFLGGGWYILGQRGVLPSPSTTFAGISTQLQAQTENVPLLGQSSQEGTGETEEATLSSTVASEPEETQKTEEETADPPADTDTSNSAAEPAEDPSPSGIDPAAGGWTIVVASRTDRAAADSLVTVFRDRFETLSLPIDIVVGEAQNTTRYRVAVGQFRTQSKVLQALDDHDELLPNGAWPLNLR